MNSKLVALKKKIFFGEHSDEEWLEIKKDVYEGLNSVSEEERQEFIECGAGPLLEQVLEYMD